MTDLLLPSPLHLVAALGFLSVWAFRRSAPRALSKMRFALVTLLAWAWLLSLPLAVNGVASPLEGRYPPPKKVEPDDEALILVLSSGFSRHRNHSWEAKLGQSGWERTYAGVRLWRQLGGVILFAGGPMPDHRSSVAEAMASVARDMGVPGEAVRVETRSTNTYENILFARPATGDHHVWLVTSAVHMPRAMAVARRLGLDFRPYPCDFQTRVAGWRRLAPSPHAPLDLASSLHEVVGLLYYRVRGWA